MSANIQTLFWHTVSIMTQMRQVQVNTMEVPSAPYVGGMSASEIDTEVEVGQRYERGGEGTT